ncbi:MAG TPA: hypothetical protein VJZ49_12250 [Syntrophales bacterium]|nr:hypothetical protein [Syntrophales bacterium]
MMTRTMICLRCGIEGEIEVQGMNSGKTSSLIFKHLGHNPFSGHLHYQCPACEVVLLVDPMTVLEGLISRYPKVAAGGDWRDQKCKIPQNESLLRRLFQNQQTG